MGALRYDGKNVTRFRQAVFARYGTVCHLCGRTGADQVDHLIPRCERPDLALDVTNARPAHGMCNVMRGRTPLPAGYNARGW